jgi:hypothetical protein
MSAAETTRRYAERLLDSVFPRRRLSSIAKQVYNYHNLGVGVFPEDEEKTPYGSGERYNFDRMYMMVSNYDFTGKHLVDLGCNSGWFCVQAKLMGSGVTVGIDQVSRGPMGAGLRYAMQFERVFRLGVTFVDADLEVVDFLALASRLGIDRFDAALVLSVLHHIGNDGSLSRARCFARLFDAVRDVIFYEDHEFWNEFFDADGRPIEVRGRGYRYGWNEDMSWQRKIAAIESYEPQVLAAYRSSWRRETLMLERFREIRLLGFSEKRRPVLALFK